MTNNYKDLIVWQKSIDFVDKVYRIANTFPPDERFGSISELDTQLIIAERLGYIKKDSKSFLTSSIEELRRMLFGLINLLKNK